MYRCFLYSFACLSMEGNTRTAGASWGKHCRHSLRVWGDVAITGEVGGLVQCDMRRRSVAMLMMFVCFQFCLCVLLLPRLVRFLRHDLLVVFSPIITIRHQELRLCALGPTPTTFNEPQLSSHERCQQQHTFWPDTKKSEGPIE
jgi:hypothetical protein